MRRPHSRLVAALAMAVAGAAAPLTAQHHADHGSRRGPRDTVPLYDNLGTLHYPIGTRVPLAQRYFDQGMRLAYGFNHAEAIASFRRAAELDSTCAMCQWGIAWAAGPNINAGMDSAGAELAVTAIRRARKLARHATEQHRAFIRAMEARYAGDALGNRKQLDSAYADAMRDLATRYPEDPQARVLFAEALMVLSPWNYWTADKQPRPGTSMILASLSDIIEHVPEHPGACHFYIHAVEAAFPERAVECAERLARLMPGAGHLVHMPGHIYIRVGRYMDAIRANEHAVHADEGWIADRRPGVSPYTAGYYPHNYDFLAFAASMIGRSKQAIAAADRVASLVTPEMVKAPGSAFAQQYLTRALQMRVRFGRWDEILNHVGPADDLVYARAIWHYARGRALVAKQRIEEAESELAQLAKAVEDARLKDVPVEFNLATSVLAIARDVLAGRIALAKGDGERAVTLLRTAAATEDALVYGEPPEWSVPVRHELGDVLLALGRASEAADVYRQDLERFPRNVWSLRGLAKSLERQGLLRETSRVR